MSIASPTRSGIFMLSDQLGTFLTDCISSIEQCEILVAMRRPPVRWWTAADLAEDLNTSESRARDSLEALATRGLLEVRLGNDVRYRLAPLSPGLADALRQLVKTYRTDLGALVGHFGRPRAH